MSVLPVHLAGSSGADSRERAARRALPLAAVKAALRAGETLAAPAGLLLLWQTASAAGWLPEQILPSPAMTAHTLADLWRSGELPADLAISLRRVGEGFAIGSALGLGLGLLTGVSRTADEMIGPLFRAIAQAPSMAWLPLLMLVLSVGEALKVTAIAKAALIPMALAVHDSVRAIPRSHLELAHALRLPRRTVLSKVVLPSALPAVFTGLRQGLGHAWQSLVGVELLASTAGLGYLMTWGRAIFQLDVVLAGIVAVGAVGLVLDLLVGLAQRRLAGWEAR